MHGEDNGKSAEYKDEDADKDESVNRNDIVVGKAIPRTYSPVPGEDRYIEEHVNGWLERVIFCFEAEPVTWVVSIIRLVEGRPRDTYSQVKTLPAIKHARTSSLPSMPRVPTMKS